MKPVSWAYLYDRIFELYKEDTGANGSLAKSGYGQERLLLRRSTPSGHDPGIHSQNIRINLLARRIQKLLRRQRLDEPNQSWSPYATSNQPFTGRAVMQEILLNDEVA